MSEGFKSVFGWGWVQDHAEEFTNLPQTPSRMGRVCTSLSNRSKSP